MEWQLALCAEDREKYGGDEWVTFDFLSLADLMSDVIEPWERQIIEESKRSITEILHLMPVNSGLVKRTMVWLARKQADVKTPDFKDFKVRDLMIAIRASKGGDADPPDRGSSKPSTRKASKTDGKS